MSLPSSRLADCRRALGLSQAALAAEAGVSLATVQNIEAGRANPSIGTLEKVLVPLGLRLALGPEPADWGALASLGLPLFDPDPTPVPATPANLARHVHQAVHEIEAEPGAPDAERKRECLQALLLAVRTHFPSVHRAWFARSAPIRGMETPPSGRTIKLARIARARLAEYL